VDSLIVSKLKIKSQKEVLYFTDENTLPALILHIKLTLWCANGTFGDRLKED
jgi:hypothetical protein